MKTTLCCIAVCILLIWPSLVQTLLPHPSIARAQLSRSLTDYYEPGQPREQKPIPIKRVLGLIIAGLSTAAILLFVFSFLMGPGERIRKKVSEKTDPFFAIVAILLFILFLAMVQAYYEQLLGWLKYLVTPK